MPSGGRTFSSQETEKARDWFWRAGADFGFVCDCADLNGSAVAGYAKDVIDGGGRRRRAQDWRLTQKRPRRSGASWITANTFASARDALEELRNREWAS